MGQIESLIFLLGVAALLAQLARVVKVPYPIFLVLGGLGLGFVPGLPAVEIPPEVIFVVFLPPLLNSAAFFSSPLDLRAHLRAITLLAVGLVFATTFTVAAVAHYAVGLPWADGISPDTEQGMRDYYEDRIRRYEAGIQAGGVTQEYAESSAAWRNWRRDLISAEREAVLSLRDEGEISPETMRRIERDLDLEESRIGG